MVTSKLQLQWSPEQVAGWLRQLFPSYEEYHVSHETIYRSQVAAVMRLLTCSLVQVKICS
ncbi:hypothetical protein D0T21_20525 [Duganella sp. BJB476]|nr:hypothetical protein D0T21_20525 [Duganella sp. BJB476]